MNYNLNYKMAFEGTYSSRGMSASFYPMDVDLDESRFIGRKDLLWWELVYRATERFLSVMLLQGSTTKENVQKELKPIIMTLNQYRVKYGLDREKELSVG